MLRSKSAAGRVGFGVVHKNVKAIFRIIRYEHVRVFFTLADGLRGDRARVAIR